MINRFIAGLLVLAMVVIPAPPAAQAQTAACHAAADLNRPASGVAVEQICYNAKAVERIGGVDIIEPTGREDATSSLAVREQIAMKTSMLIPAATFVDLVSEHANRVRARHGTRTTIVGVSPSGEEIGLDGSGGAGFIVQHALNFFRVDVGRFIAAVHGTIFDVGLEDPASVTFGVTQGVVSVTRLVSIRLVKERRTVDNIRVSEYIGAGSQVTYARAAELWMSFSDAATARKKFNQDLAGAAKLNDQLLEEDARWNLTRLDAVLPAQHALNASQTVALHPVIAGAFLGVIATAIAISSASSPAQAQGLVPGTIGLHGFRRNGAFASSAPGDFGPVAIPMSGTRAGDRNARGFGWRINISFPLGGSFLKAAAPPAIVPNACVYFRFRGITNCLER